jgi:hypothetical protein
MEGAVMRWSRARILPRITSRANGHECAGETQGLDSVPVPVESRLLDLSSRR